MDDIIVIAILAVIVALAVIYIIRAKKNGKKCIGCHISNCPNKGGCGLDCSNCSSKSK